MPDTVSEPEEAAVRRILTATAKVLERELREVSQGDRAVLIVSLPPGRHGLVHAIGDFTHVDDLRSFLAYVIENMDQGKNVWVVP